jgi:hypothetical protein
LTKKKTSAEPNEPNEDQGSLVLAKLDEVLRVLNGLEVRVENLERQRREDVARKLSPDMRASLSGRTPFIQQTARPRPRSR